MGDNFFNLSFGDWNEELQKLDDSTRSNNGDRDKVLTTVAYTAMGNVPARQELSSFLDPKKTFS
jgi:hypothetical protein